MHAADVSRYRVGSMSKGTEIAGRTSPIRGGVRQEGSACLRIRATKNGIPTRRRFLRC